MISFSTLSSRALWSLPLATMLLLAGCARGPAPSLYMLDLPFAAEMAGIEKGIAVGIGPVEFPQYLDRPQIITRDGANRLFASEAHVWAEPIKSSASRVLAVTIAGRLDSNRVYLVPRRVRTPLDWRAEIDVGRFDGSLGGNVLLAVRWSLYRGEDKAVVLSRVSVIEEAVATEGEETYGGPRDRERPVAAGGYEVLVAAQTRALTRLGEEIADAITAAGG